MSRTHTILLLGVAFAIFCGVLLQGLRLRAATAAAASAEASARSLRLDVTTVERLRLGRETLALHPRPAADVVTEVQGVLAEAGIPSRHFESLVPEGDERVAGSEAALRRQGVRLTLSELPLADLGRFLDRLRTSAPLWTATSIELIRGPSAPPEGNVFGVQVQLSATYTAAANPGGGTK